MVSKYSQIKLRHKALMSGLKIKFNYSHENHVRKVIEIVAFLWDSKRAWKLTIN